MLHFSPSRSACRISKPYYDFLFICHPSFSLSHICRRKGICDLQVCSGGSSHCPVSKYLYSNTSFCKTSNFSSIFLPGDLGAVLSLVALLVGSLVHRLTLVIFLDCTGVTLFLFLTVFLSRSLWWSPLGFYGPWGFESLSFCFQKKSAGLVLSSYWYFFSFFLPCAPFSISHDRTRRSFLCFIPTWIYCRWMDGGYYKPARTMIISLWS